MGNSRPRPATDVRKVLAIARAQWAMAMPRTTTRPSSVWRPWRSLVAAVHWPVGTAWGRAVLAFLGA